jgi:hypothetical protein
MKQKSHAWLVSVCDAKRRRVDEVVLVNRRAAQALNFEIQLGGVHTITGVVDERDANPDLPVLYPQLDGVADCA